MAFAENTTVPIEKSIAEITTMVRKAGAESIGQFQEPDKLVIFFALADRRIKFTIPLATKYDGALVARNGKIIDPKAKIEQANRQKARALRLVVQAKLESVESGVETFEQAFLANIVLDGGQTVYERVAEPISLEYSTGKAGLLMLGFGEASR